MRRAASSVRWGRMRITVLMERQYLRIPEMTALMQRGACLSSTATGSIDFFASQGREKH
jgi:hypothetical protein